MQARLYLYRMIYTVLLTLVIIAFAILLLGIKVFFTQKGTFPNSHVGESRALREKGISCATSQDLEDRDKKNIFGLSNSENK